MVFKDIGPQKDYKRSKDIFYANDDDGDLKKMLMMFKITLEDYVVEEEVGRSWFQIGEGFEDQIAWKTLCQ